MLRLVLNIPSAQAAGDGAIVSCPDLPEARTEARRLLEKFGKRVYLLQVIEWFDPPAAIKPTTITLDKIRKGQVA